MAPVTPPEALLLDLGGVLLEVDFERALRCWSAFSPLSLAELRRRFGFDEAYRRHERGEIDAATYFDSLRRTLRLDATDAQIEAGWNAILAGEIRAAVKLAARAAQALPCFLLSNSNETHRRVWSSRLAATLPELRGVFVSCDLGVRKPEPAVFQAVTSAIGCHPSRILLLDDTLENVIGARRAGLQAELVRTPAELAGALAGALAGGSRRSRGGAARGP